MGFQAIGKKKTKKKKKKHGKRKVKGVSQSQTAAFPRHQEEETKPNMHKWNKRTKNTKISSLFHNWGNHNAKMTEKHKDKITQGKNKTNRLVLQYVYSLRYH